MLRCETGLSKVKQTISKIGKRETVMSAIIARDQQNNQGWSISYGNRGNQSDPKVKIIQFALVSDRTSYVQQ